MIGVVLAGGASARFGGEPKGLKLLRGVPLVLHVARVLQPLCAEVLLEDNGFDGYDGPGLARISARPEYAGKGPLAGLAAGLSVAQHGDMVAFAPCDMPLLTTVTYVLLGAYPNGCYAVSPRGDEPLVCVLPVTARPHVEAALSLSDVPPVALVMANIGAQAVRFNDAGPFMNVNTPEDLMRLNAGG